MHHCLLGLQILYKCLNKALVTYDMQFHMLVTDLSYNSVGLYQQNIKSWLREESWLLLDYSGYFCN